MLKKKKESNVLRERFVYMIEVDNRGRKSRFFGHKKLLYVGHTYNIRQRFLEHLHNVGGGFIVKNFPDSRKKLVYVEHVYGTEYDAIGRELQVKKLPLKKKIDLISSSSNALVNYIPVKAIVLKRVDGDGEECLRL